MRYVEANIPEGFRLKVRYYTRLRNHRGKYPPCDAKWFTIAKLYDKNDLLCGHGQSSCSERDTPNRKVGRAIAVGRAVKQYYTTFANIQQVAA